MFSIKVNSSNVEKGPTKCQNMKSWIFKNRNCERKSRKKRTNKVGRDLNLIFD